MWFFSLFEQVADDLNWGNEERTLLLQTVLVGRGQKAFVALPSAERKVYTYKPNANHTKRSINQDNLIKIQTLSAHNEICTILKLGLINIRSLTSKGALINELITDNNIQILFLTETWLKPD